MLDSPPRTAADDAEPPTFAGTAPELVEVGGLTAPRAPRTPAETGLDEGLLKDLLVKAAFTYTLKYGTFPRQDSAASTAQFATWVANSALWKYNVGADKLHQAVVEILCFLP